MSHAIASVGGTEIARADKWEVVEGNIYFPPASVEKSYLTKTDTHTFCPWKGTASYYAIDVNGQHLKDAAWYYPEPKEKAQNIKDHVAFYKTKVSVTTSD